MVELLHEQGFLVCELIRLFWVDGGEVTRHHLIGLTIKFAKPLLIIHMFEETAVFHLPLGVTLEDLCFCLELQYGDGFVHLGSQLARLLIHLIARKQAGNEFFAGIVAIDFEGESGQGDEVDTIFLNGAQVGVSQTEAQHIADAGVIASRGTHPEDIMIAPLNVPRVILSEGVHDFMGTWTTIVDITKNMQLVDGQTLNHITDSADEVVCTTCGNDGVHDDSHIGSLVDIVGAFVKQFLDDI